MAPIRIEAEDMTLMNYLIEAGNSAASGGKLISLWNAASSTGSASFNFTGLAGTYDLVLSYFDENDGNATVTVNVGENSYTTNFNQNLGSGSATAQTLVRRTLATGISITQGQTISLSGIAERAEWARVDYIELIPVVSSPPPTDTTAPTASLSTTNISTGGGNTHTFTVTYSDNTALNVSSLDGNDLRVSGPNGFTQLATLVSVDTNSNGTPRTATYRINAPGGSWDAVDNGTYTLSMQANQVSDTNNNFVQGGSLGSFQVNVAAPPPSQTPIRIEAETMTATTYRIESNSAASGGNMLSLYQSGGSTGTASTTFNGSSGIYDVIIGYFDENDGQSPLSVQVGANQYSWTANQNLGTGGVSSQNLVRRTVVSGLTVNQGDAINITGTVNQSEWARVDYIEFVPVQNTPSSTINGTNAAETLTGNAQDNTINGLGGNDILNGGDGQDTLDGGLGNNILNGGNGNDTVSYASSSGGIIANLETGLVNRKFVTSSTTPHKMMLFGDSNTRGKEPGVNEPYRAGYRDDLWALLKDGGFNIDFVGSAKAEGPSTVTGQNGTYTFDKNHQGHGGYAIKGSGALGELYPNVTTWLNNAKPNTVLLMAGTNDFIFQNTTAEATVSELGELIDRIFAYSPNVNVFVSTIAPISSDRSYAQEAAEYNDLIPSLLAQDKYLGKNLNFVDTRSVLSTTDLWDGIHLTNAGYAKQANAWHDAILRSGSGRDSLSSIENIVGSAYNDELTGDSRVNVLNGGAGNDIIRGAGGNDSLIGGAGNDTFVLAAGEGIDTITDFLLNQDRLGLMTGLTFEQLSIFQGSDANANNTFINIASSGEQLAILSGVQASTLTSSAFALV